jgi:hypothetical protein
MNPLRSFITRILPKAWFSPYEAANHSPGRGRVPGAAPRDAKLDLLPGTRRELVRRSRYLHKNSGFVRELVGSMAIYATGDGIKPQALSPSPEWNKAAEEYFAHWAARCEVDLFFGTIEIVVTQYGQVGELVRGPPSPTAVPAARAADHSASEKRCSRCRGKTVRRSRNRSWPVIIVRPRRDASFFANAFSQSNDEIFSGSSTAMFISAIHPVEIGSDAHGQKAGQGSKIGRLNLDRIFRF